MTATHEVSALELGQAYFELQHQLHRVVEKAMACEGLSLGRSKVLLRLQLDGPMNQARLAGLLGFAPRSVTDAVDTLVRDGLITRSDDPTDRRCRILALTPDGEDAAAVAHRLRARAMSEIFGGLDAGQRATLLELFTTIRNDLRTGEPDVR